MYRILYFVIFISVTIFGQINERNYGPYKIEFFKFETCKGPKRGECGSVRIDNIRNMSNIPFIMDFPKDCPVKNARVIVGTLQNSNKTKKLWNYQPSKPCQHFVLGPLLMKSFNMSNNCNVMKELRRIYASRVITCQAQPKGAGKFDRKCKLKNVARQTQIENFL